MKIRGRKRYRTEKIRTGSLWTFSIAAAFVAAVTVFCVMVRLEKSVLTQYEKGVIYTAVKQIPKGQMITENNYHSFIEMKELDRSCIPKTALQRPEQAQGLAALADIEQGVLLTSGMFEDVDEILEQMTEPVIAGFKAEDLYQVAGGVLRAGDRIDIYSVQEDGQAVLVWEEVFVQQVFDGAGAAIGSGDKTTAAQRINVYLAKADVGKFYGELALGSLRAVKICQ